MFLKKIFYTGYTIKFIILIKQAVTNFHKYLEPHD